MHLTLLLMPRTLRQFVTGAKHDMTRISSAIKAKLSAVLKVLAKPTINYAKCCCRGPRKSQASDQADSATHAEAAKMGHLTSLPRHRSSRLLLFASLLLLSVFEQVLGQLYHLHKKRKLTLLNSRCSPPGSAFETYLKQTGVQVLILSIAWIQSQQFVYLQNGFSLVNTAAVASQLQ